MREGRTVTVINGKTVTYFPPEKLTENYTSPEYWTVSDSEYTSNPWSKFSMIILTHFDKVKSLRMKVEKEIEHETPWE